MSMKTAPRMMQPTMVAMLCLLQLAGWCCDLTHGSSLWSLVVGGSGRSSQSQRMPAGQGSSTQRGSRWRHTKGLIGSSADAEANAARFLRAMLCSAMVWGALVGGVLRRRGERLPVRRRAPSDSLDRCPIDAFTRSRINARPDIISPITRTG